MRKTLIVCALTLALAACDKGNAPAAGTSADAATPAASATDIAAESKRLNEWFDKKYEEQLKFSPIQLTFQGRKDLYDQVDDMSEQAQRDQVAWQKASVEEMEKTFDYAKAYQRSLTFHNPNIPLSHISKDSFHSSEVEHAEHKKNNS